MRRTSDLRGAVLGSDAPRPHARQEWHDRRRPAAQPAQRLAVAAVDRGRAGNALRRQMLHQAQEIRQVLRRDALFVERQDEVAPDGLQQEVGVLHRSEEHTSELQSLMRISYAVFCLKKKKQMKKNNDKVQSYKKS